MIDLDYAKQVFHLEQENKILSDILDKIEQYIKDGENGLLIYNMGDIKRLVTERRDS